MKYSVVSYSSADGKIYTKEFKTYEKAKPYFELECSLPNNMNVQLMDVIEEKK